MSDADVQQGVTVDLVVRYRLDVHKVYAAYLEMGGMNQEAEVAGCLGGSLGLLQLQRDLVANAVNAELNDPYPKAGSMRAPYSCANIARASGYAVSELDGERLAEHRRPLHHAMLLEKDAETDRSLPSTRPSSSTSR